MADRAEWQMPVVTGSTGTGLPVDADRLAGLEDALAKLTARADFAAPAGTTPEMLPLYDAFVSDDPTAAQLKAWGFDTPARSVDLAFRDAKKRTLLIAKTDAPGAAYHAKLSDAPTVYSIPPAILEALSVDPLAYRRRTLFAMQPGDRLVSLRVTDLATGKALLDERSRMTSRPGRPGSTAGRRRRPRNPRVEGRRPPARRAELPRGTVLRRKLPLRRS